MSDDAGSGGAVTQPGSRPWPPLAGLTPARVALGRAGDSLTTAALLALSLDHARARDAVLAPFDAVAVAERITASGWPAVVAESQATDRRTHLLRPDLGRRLAPAARARLVADHDTSRRAHDIVCIVSDGLSAPAAEAHAPALARALLPSLAADGWRIAPVVVVPRGRVALGDEIGELFAARLALVLLGERPGLTAPASLGAYFVHDPRPGRTDAERNCVSNIHPGGLPPAAAAATLLWLLREARARGISGVALKDDREPPRLPPPAPG